MPRAPPTIRGEETVRCSFVHFGDVHLGTQQYDCPERLNDFGRAWRFACEYIARTRPDFAICAGDLFNRFTINPVTFDQAFHGLALLREAGVPLVDIQGNHDRTRYGEAKSWIESFADQGLLTHLDLSIGPSGVELRPVDPVRHSGGYVEWSGCRIIGMRYLGASTERILNELVPKLAPLRADGAFTILVLHAGLEGIVPHVHAELSATAIEGLREHVDYLALGHLHKYYTSTSLVYNGGSLETWAMNEWGWPRGLLHVEVDTSRPQPVTFQLIEVPRRPFVIIKLEVNQFENPRALFHACWERLEEERARGQQERPVVAVVLKGRLRFDQQDLPVDRIERACRETLDALVTLVREDYDTREFAIDGPIDDDEPLDRAVLEQSVLQARIAEDERYARHASALARLAIDLKEQALRGADGPTLLQALRASLQEIDGAARSVSAPPAERRGEGVDQ